MTWSPVVPLAWLVLLSLGAFAACAWRRPRPASAAVLRGASIVLLAFIAAGPGRSVEGEREAVPPSVTVLVDGSASLDLLGVGAALRDAWLTPGALDGLREVARVTLIDHTGAPVPTGDGSERDASPLVSTIERVLAVSRPEHLVLLTDGIDTTGRSLSAIDPGTTRVHTLHLDASDAPPDARVVCASGTALAYAGQPATLRVSVQQRGLDGRRTRLVVSHEDRVVHERDIVFDAPVSGFDVEVTPTLPDGVTQGVLAYSASLEPVAGEAESSNNSGVALLRVSAEPIRVLVLEGQPHWDTRFFVRAMRADGQVEVTSASTLDDRFRAGTREPRVRVTRSGLLGEDRPVALPVTTDDLASYDVIVLGRGVEQFFPGRDAEALLHAIGQRGRSLLMLRGDPVVSTAPEARRTARVLEPLLSGAIERSFSVGDLRRVGAGFVLSVEEGAGFRGALLTPDASPERRSAYARTWSSVVRTLATGSGMAPGASVDLSASPPTLAPGERVEIRARARDADVVLPASVRIETPSGDTTELVLGIDPGTPLVRGGSFTANAQGVYSVRDGAGREARFVVVEDRAERTMLTPAVDELRDLAQATAGTVFGASDGPDPIVRALSAQRAMRATPPMVEPLWDAWWVALVLIGLMLCEWSLRRRADS
ncbi:MAG: hypothetical protein Tsb0013_16300 [Phycisphaerales bacterium]